MSSAPSLGIAARNISGCRPDRRFVTTAISYTNGQPHIGHAYEFISADILARYYRILGYTTFFLTGTDEHGQKVAASAAKVGKSPKEHCDFFVDAFQSLDAKLNISYDRFIRTTDEDHILTCQKLWRLCADDIYLDRYVGWYNEREECFVTDADAEANDFKDPGNGLPLKRVEEESYFFRMSRYCDQLQEHIAAHPTFIQPEQFKLQIQIRLEKEGLKDLSISRTSFSWGIPVEGDSRHVMYVWFDALTNYLSGVHGLDRDHELASFWPANVHIIGKDIIWFHCVIWPCMLLSAGIPLPGSIFSHGFINAADGRKMSKSYNNTIDPFEILNSFAADSIRYYLCSSVTYGSDLNFSIPSLVTRHNDELADILGNLVNRALTLADKFCGGEVPDTRHDPDFEIPFSLSELFDGTEADIKECCIHAAAFRAMRAASATNGYLQKAEPWKLKGAENETRRKAIVRTTLECLYVLMHFLGPVIPSAAQQVLDRLNTPARPAFDLDHGFYNLTPGTKVDGSSIILFKKIEAASESPIETIKKPPTPLLEDPDQSEFSKLEIRVGKIVKIKQHEESEKLYVEDIDVGEAQPRQVVSGLRAAYTLDQLKDRLVLVLCNIKEAKLAGALSNGLVLAATSGDGMVELIEPPNSCAVGDRVFTVGQDGAPWPAAKVKKMKIWEAVKADLKTNNDRVATWKGNTILTSQGPCAAASLSNAIIF